MATRARQAQTLTFGESWMTFALACLGAAALVLSAAASAGAYPGDRAVQGQIVVVGLDEQEALRVAVVRGSDDGWRVVTGTIESVSGTTAIISGRSGQWTVDLSPLADIDQVTLGEQVTIVGRIDGGRLVASGIARDTDAPSALPPSR